MECLLKKLRIFSKPCKEHLPYITAGKKDLQNPLAFYQITSQLHGLTYNFLADAGDIFLEKSSFYQAINILDDWHHHAVVLAS
jgi:hypothetical protein